MKKIILTILTSIVTFTLCFSQDIITKKSGEVLQVKVLEVTKTGIEVRKFEGLDSTSFFIPKSDILMVSYENGTKEIYSEDMKNGKDSISNLTSVDLFAKGQSDATIYYKGYKGAGTATLIIGLVSPLVGLLPAVACSSTPPNEKNLSYPNANLMKDSDYYKGYTTKSKKIKQGKVWSNLGIAFGVNLVLVLVLM